MNVHFVLSKSKVQPKLNKQTKNKQSKPLDSINDICENFVFL